MKIMTKMLISQESINAYKERLKQMAKYKLSKEGDDLFIEEMIATASQLENLNVCATINDFSVQCDEPESLCGTKRAPRPMELFIASLANCLETGALLYFSFSNVNIESVNVEVKAKFDKRAVLKVPNAPLPGFYDISLTWHVKSNARHEKIIEVLERVENNCPVKGTILGKPKISSTIIYS